MENADISRTVLSGPHLGNHISLDRFGIPAFLRNRRGLLFAAVVLGAIGLVTGWKWFGTAAVLLVLYTLPCAVMMLMCMRGHSKSDNTSAQPTGSAEAGPDLIT